MNHHKHLLTLATAAVALLGALSSYAQTYGDGETAREHAAAAAWQSTLSRAEVIAAQRQAHREGRAAYGDRADLPLTVPFESRLSRAQVRAEAIEARRLGLLDGSGDAAARIATPAQALAIRNAGLRAIGVETLAAPR